jgi:hypothetical protein
VIQKGRRYSKQGWIESSTCCILWKMDENVGKQLIEIMHQIKLIYFNKLNNKVLVNQLLDEKHDHIGKQLKCIPRNTKLL